jgi:diguanylate cyclase (GGDEF)-like protein
MFAAKLQVRLTEDRPGNHHLMTPRKAPSKQSQQSTRRGGGPQPAIVQEHREDAPVNWAETQDALAAEAGLSILLVDGRQPPALVTSHNNSICRAFQTSLEHVSLCDPYCGDAHRRALAAGSAVQYQCHAGLHCVALPVEISGTQKLAAIGGRAFQNTSDYRSLIERFRAGELNSLLDSNPFTNIIFAEDARLDRLAERITKTVRNFNRASNDSSNSLLAAATSEGVGAAQEATGAVARRQMQSSSPADSFAPLPDLRLEVERLRGELEHRSQLAQSLQRFLARISTRDPARTYDAILNHSRELLQAERASLWLFDESSNEISLKSAVGFATAEPPKPARLGEGISGKVLESGTALVVASIEQTELTPAPPERRYKTKSFISYPITMGRRKIGVLNVADKVGGENFDDVDLSLLEIVGPQIAIALERAEWQERATQFQLMSITDPLTGLLNRRYLEERLTEELNRSQRYHYAMSCLMIDIDDFKTYNDQNGHQAGDDALKITAHALKATLRSADVACRYGGEEFCVLLPQTSLSEAATIAERMRQRVTETDYPYGQNQPRGTVSISIGVSALASQINTAESVIAAADRALYRAKHLGKNRIEFFDDSVINPMATK